MGQQVGVRSGTVSGSEKETSKWECEVDSEWECETGQRVGV